MCSHSHLNDANKLPEEKPYLCNDRLIFSVILHAIINRTLSYFPLSLKKNNFLSQKSKYSRIYFFLSNVT